MRHGKWCLFVTVLMPMRHEAVEGVDQPSQMAH